MPAGLTRRRLLASAAAGAVASAAGPPAAAAAAPADHALLSHALDVERLLVWAYERALATGFLGPGAHPMVSALLEHEREHVSVLEMAAGLAASAPLTTRAALAQLARHQVGAGVAHLATQHDCLRLLVDLESVGEGTWFHAVGKLSDPGLARLGAEIMAAEAQHWTVLSGISHHGDVMSSVPYAFVRGTQ